MSCGSQASVMLGLLAYPSQTFNFSNCPSCIAISRYARMDTGRVRDMTTLTVAWLIWAACMDAEDAVWLSLDHGMRMEALRDLSITINRCLITTGV